MRSHDVDHGVAAELPRWYGQMIASSPKWTFDDATFSRTAAAFNNPDHVSIVIHNYRWRLSLAGGEPRYKRLEQKLSQGPVISAPAITIASDFDGPAALAVSPGSRTHPCDGR